MDKAMLLSLVGRVIRVDRGGPESRTGQLLAADEDYFTMLTEDDGIIYYKTHHIKSITDSSKNELSIDVELPENFSFFREKDFKSVLEKLRYQWVKINRGGPETLEGVMEAVTDDFVTIVLNEEVIRLSMFHIRNVSYGAKVEKEDDVQEANSAEEEKTKTKTKQKDGKKKEGK